MRFEHSIDIDASQQRVWDVVTDIEAWPRRIETVDEVEALTPAPIGVGSRFRLKQPKLPEHQVPNNQAHHQCAQDAQKAENTIALAGQCGANEGFVLDSCVRHIQMIRLVRYAPADIPMILPVSQTMSRSRFPCSHARQ